MSASLNQGASERAPSRTEAIRRHIDMALADVRKMLPGVVTKYDAATQKVDVKPLIRNAFLDEEDERQTESMPVIPSVPVQFLSAGGFTFYCPISDGSLTIEGSTVPATMGALVFSDRSMDKWLSGDGQEVDPEIDHEHGLSDALFIPGLNPFGAPLSGLPTDHAFAGLAGGVGIHFHKQVIALGDENGNDFVALAMKVKQDLDQIKSDFDAHTHMTTVAQGPSAPAPLTSLPPGSPMSSPASVAASQVKAK